MRIGPLYQLRRRLSAGFSSLERFLVNLSVEVASTALVELCQEKGALYLDTCIEPWPGGYTDHNLSVSLRSNYALREDMLKLAPTNVPTMPAPPIPGSEQKLPVQESGPRKRV